MSTLNGEPITLRPTGAVNWKGLWNADTNVPDLPAATPANGDYYIVSVAGSTSLGGITDWEAKDWAIYSGDVWTKVDNTDLVASVFGRVGVVVAAASDYDASQVDNDSTVVGATVKDALDRVKGPFALIIGNTTLTAVDSGKIYGVVPGGSDDPIVVDLPVAGATAELKFFLFNASGKPVQFACGGSEFIYLNMPGASPPSKIQLNENFGFLSIVSTGLGSYIIMTGSGRWFDADMPTHFHLFDGPVHDGTDLIYTLNKGAHKFVTEAQFARGTMTIVGGQPVADETFVIGVTTITAKADGSGNIDHFTIGGTVPETIANIVATLAECSEAANIRAWDGPTTVVVEWKTGGVVGNGKVFTEAMSFTSVDGGGTLGGTHAGVDAATLLIIGQNKALTMPGDLNHDGANAGFYGTTPTTQPAAVADATGAGDVVAQLNALLAGLRTNGTIAT